MRGAMLDANEGLNWSGTSIIIHLSNQNLIVSGCKNYVAEKKFPHVHFPSHSIKRDSLAVHPHRQ